MHIKEWAPGAPSLQHVQEIPGHCLQSLSGVPGRFKSLVNKIEGYTVGSIPVLMYHHVNSHKGDPHTVSEDVFEAQMAHLSRAGYRTLKIGEMLDWLEGRLPIKERAVVVTFDDGWIDNYLFAYPILKKYGIHASFFVVTDWLEKASAENLLLPESVPNSSESKRLVSANQEHRVILNWNLIAKMARSGIIDFYSHSRSHPECAQLSHAKLTSELAGSRAVIEAKLKQPCPYFCWPYGNFSDAAIEVAKDSGYKALFTTAHDVVRQGSDPFALGRIAVQDSIGWFKTRLLIYTNPVLFMLYGISKKIMKR